MLTSYQLACGYRDQIEQHGIRVTLWMEHGTYHVRAHDFNEHYRIDWQSFYTLAEARRIFQKMVRKHVKPLAAV